MPVSPTGLEGEPLEGPPTTPAETPAAMKTDDEPTLVEEHLDEQPTASHALADESVAATAPMDKGASQVIHGNIEVKDMGWNDQPQNVPHPIVGGLSNEDLWALVRRFDKQIFHVRKIQNPPLAELDLNIADDEDFSPEKLRSQLERLYMIVLIGLFSFYKQIVRLRSWREWQRTLTFLYVYVTAWYLDLLIPTMSAFAIMLVLSPRARVVCFPPAPPSLIDPDTGGVKKPPAGVLASQDSVTGAPEKFSGEAIEQEAHSFVTSVATVCSGLVVGTPAGKHPEPDPHEDNSAPDPTELPEYVANARDKSTGEEPTLVHDKTKQPISNAVWEKARPGLHMMADFVDTWERFGNALSPTAPFPRLQPRLLLAGFMVPVLLGSCMLTSYMMTKFLGFVAGFAFFGQPLMSRGLIILNRRVPGWQRYLELRHTLLKGIPTNAQLTLTLLRVGERNKAPIPPPPSSDEPPPSEPHATAGENLEHLGVPEEEVEAAIQPEPGIDDVKDEQATGTSRKPHRILNMLKRATKGGVHTALTADKAKAKAGAKHARHRLGAVKGRDPIPATGPIRFPARYRGHKGHAYITATATTPAISWTSNIQDVDPAWTTTIAEIGELKKVGGLGWKSKLVVGWALGREIVDGLVVKRTDGAEMQLTAVAMRDELFNRLVAMGNQMWEAR